MLVVNLGKAKVLASCGDGGVELLSEVLVTLVLWKIEFCEDGQYCVLQVIVMEG